MAFNLLAISVCGVIVHEKSGDFFQSLYNVHTRLHPPCTHCVILHIYMETNMTICTIKISCMHTFIRVYTLD